MTIQWSEIMSDGEIKELYKQHGALRLSEILGVSYLTMRSHLAKIKVEFRKKGRPRKEVSRG